jgi:hypothetical protein
MSQMQVVICEQLNTIGPCSAATQPITVGIPSGIFLDPRSGGKAMRCARLGCLGAAVGLHTAQLAQAPFQ